jgi:hypothetical protein
MGKVCCACGKDLTGHTRFKDSIGYWCKDCHRTDKRRRQGIKCAGCGREFPEQKLILFEHEHRCATCEKERQDHVIKKLNAAAKKVRYGKKELHELRMMGLVLLLLGVIIAMKYFNLI